MLQILCRSRDPGLDRTPVRRAYRRGRPGRRRARRARTGPRSCRGRKGVLLAAGGFAHNADMRRRVRRRPAQRGKVVDRQPGRHRRGARRGDAPRRQDRPDGRGVVAAVAAHRPLRPVDPRPGPPTPRTIYVDAAGKRFVNESNSYMEVGKAMYARDKTSRAVPCWLIFDDRYRKRYAHLRSSPAGRLPESCSRAASLKQAWTLEDLAAMCGIDPAGLTETVERFNDHAQRGVDPDYGRGESAYNRALGDPEPQGAPVPRPDRRAPVLRRRGRARRHRHLRRPGHRRARAGPRPGRPADRGSVRHRQQHRDRHGPPLPRARAPASPTPWSSATSPPATPPKSTTLQRVERQGPVDRCRHPDSTGSVLCLRTRGRRWGRRWWC